MNERLPTESPYQFIRLAIAFHPRSKIERRLVERTSPLNLAPPLGPWSPCIGDPRIENLLSDRPLFVVLKTGAQRRDCMGRQLPFFDIVDEIVGNCWRCWVSDQLESEPTTSARTERHARDSWQVRFAQKKIAVFRDIPHRGEPTTVKGLKKVEQRQGAPLRLDDEIAQHIHNTPNILAALQPLSQRSY
jgi:hypothetical protein